MGITEAALAAQLFDCPKAQPDIIRDPGSRRIAQLRFQCRAHLVEKSLPLTLVYGIGKGLGKNIEPNQKIAGQRRRARDQLDDLDRKAGLPQQRGLFLRGRIIPRIDRLGINAAPAQSRVENRTYRSHVPFAAELTNEAPARL